MHCTLEVLQQALPAIHRWLACMLTHNMPHKAFSADKSALVLSEDLRSIEGPRFDLQPLHTAYLSTPDVP